MKDAVVLTQKSSSPVTVQVKQEQWLIVGGGPQAFDTLKLLFRNNKQVPVQLISEDIEDTIKRFAERHRSVQWHEKRFELSDLADHHMIVIATGNKILDEKIQAEAKQQNILVCSQSNPQLSDFVFPVNENL